MDYLMNWFNIFLFAISFSLTCTGQNVHFDKFTTIVEWHPDFSIKNQWPSEVRYTQENRWIPFTTDVKKKKKKKIILLFTLVDLYSNYLTHTMHIFFRLLNVVLLCFVINYKFIFSARRTCEKTKLDSHD